MIKVLSFIKFNVMGAEPRVSPSELHTHTVTHSHIHTHSHTHSRRLLVALDLLPWLPVGSEARCSVSLSAGWFLLLQKI